MFSVLIAGVWRGGELDGVVGSTWPAQPATVRAQAMAPPTDQVIHREGRFLASFLENFNALQSHSNELTKGPSELQ